MKLLVWFADRHGFPVVLQSQTKQRQAAHAWPPHNLGGLGSVEWELGMG